jgi:hypothetical protein
MTIKKKSFSFISELKPQIKNGHQNHWAGSPHANFKKSSSKREEALMTKSICGKEQAGHPHDDQ